MSNLINVGAERALIAGLCQHGYNAFIDINQFVDINTFTVPQNQMMYRCLSTLFEQGVTNVDIASIITIAKTLNYDELLTKEKKDLEYIQALFDFPIYAPNVKNQAIVLMNLYVARQYQLRHKEAYQKLNEIKGDEGLDQIIALSEGAILNMVSELGVLTDDDPKLIFEDIEEYITEKMDNPVDCIGVPTPFPIYNSVIGGGLRPGITLLVARPKNGKSTIAKDVGVYVSSKYDYPVLYIDTEMDESEQKDRSIATASRTNISRVETGNVSDREREKILKEIQQLKGLKFYHKHVGGRSFDSIMSIIKRWIHKVVGFDENNIPNKHIIIYDYFKLMDTEELKSSGLSEHQALGYQFQTLSNFCKQYQSPVLAFGQTNRDGINNDTSAVIAQSDRLLWFCISAFLFKRKTSEEIAEDGHTNGNTKFVQIESRHGNRLDAGDWINFQFDLEYSTVRELDTHHNAVKKARKPDSGFNLDEPDEYDD